MIYNYRIHELLKNIVEKVPEDAKIQINSATVALMVSSGHNSSQQLAAMWKALGLPTEISGKEARSLLQKYEEIAAEGRKKVYRM